MQVKTQGLIIREQTVGESDRLVTVLTRDAGVVRAFARRAKNLKDSKSAATQLLCYSRLSIFKGREKYMIDDAEPIEVFFGLRRDIAALSLAQYFCELAYLMVPEDTDSEEYLRLILNSLHFLSKGTRPIRLLQSRDRAAYALVGGLYARLVACENCAAYEAETMFFLPQRGIILCDKCFHGANEPSLPPKTDRHATLRMWILRSSITSLPEDALKILNAATESYVVRGAYRRRSFIKRFWINRGD